MITVHYENDVKDFRRVNYYTAFVKNGGMYPSILMVALSIVALILGIGGMNGGLIVAIAFFGAGIAMFLFRFFRTRSRVNDILRRAKDFPNVKNTYVFDEETINVETKVGKKTERKTILYTQLWEARETSRFYLLYVDNNMCFIIGKRGINEEDKTVLSGRFKGLDKKLKEKRKKAKRIKKSKPNDKSFIGR